MPYHCTQTHHTAWSIVYIHRYYSLLLSHPFFFLKYLTVCFWKRKEDVRCMNQETKKWKERNCVNVEEIQNQIKLYGGKNWASCPLVPTIMPRGMRAGALAACNLARKAWHHPSSVSVLSLLQYHIEKSRWAFSLSNDRENQHQRAKCWFPNALAFWSHFLNSN